MKPILSSAHQGFRWPAYLFFSSKPFAYAEELNRESKNMIASIKKAVRGLWNMTNFDELALEGGPVASVARPAARRTRQHAAHQRKPVTPVASTQAQPAGVQDPLEKLLSISVQSDLNAARFHTVRQTPTIQICYYDSLIQLHAATNMLEDFSDSHRLSAFMVLDDNFSGHLPTLIARQQPALQLVLAVPGGRLPGNVTVGDLDAACGSLGWREIVFERELNQSLASTIDMLEEEDRLVVFWPAWHDRQQVERMVQG